MRIIYLFLGFVIMWFSLRLADAALALPELSLTFMVIQSLFWLTLLWVIVYVVRRETKRF